MVWRVSWYIGVETTMEGVETTVVDVDTTRVGDEMRLPRVMLIS